MKRKYQSNCFNAHFAYIEFKGKKICAFSCAIFFSFVRCFLPISLFFNRPGVSNRHDHFTWLFACVQSVFYIVMFQIYTSACFFGFLFSILIFPFAVSYPSGLLIGKIILVTPILMSHLINIFKCAEHTGVKTN